MDVSVVIIAHDEGIISYYAMKSALRAIERAQQDGISCELLILLDCADKETLDVFSQHKLNDVIKIFFVSFSNLSQSKNFGVCKAKGKYVTFLRANDLMSQNWLKYSFNLLENFKESAVTHPTLDVSFFKDGADRIIEENFATSDLMDFALLSGNAYSNVCFACKSIFLKFPYVFEDEFTDPNWEFNAAVTKARIPHLITKETIGYHYEKVIPRKIGTEKVLSTTLYEGKISIRLLYHQKKILLYLLFFIKYPIVLFRPSRFWKLLQRFLNKKYFRSDYLAHWYNKLLGIPTRKPKWFIDEIVSINSINPTILSASYKYCGIVNRAFRRCNFAESLCISNCIDKFSRFGKAELVLFANTLFAGGAEKVFRKYLDVLLKNKKKVFCVFENKGNSQIKTVDYILYKAQLSKAQASKVIAYFLNYSNPGIVYACNSGIFYDALLYYGRYISKRIREGIYLNAFASSYTKNTRERFWITTNIGMVSPYVSRILVDNLGFKKELGYIYGIESNKVVCNYTPCTIKEFMPNFVENGSLNVFWASRICQTKRLDILLKIVKACKLLPITFHIFGDQDKGYSDRSYVKLKRCPKVKIYGAYNGFDSIINKEFDLFIYTSESDGIPNVLLEAMSFGYPVIAPDVGGIKDLVNNDNGFLVDNYLDYEQYVDILKKVMVNKASLRKKQLYMRNTLNSKFCEDRFEENVEKLFHLR